MRNSILHSAQSNSNEGFGYKSFAGKADFVIPAKVKIDGFAHNHVVGGLSISSPADLVQFYNMHSQVFGGSGLKPFRGDSTGFNNWTPIKLENTNVVSDDCN